jgi:hypothetical protein
MPSVGIDEDFIVLIEGQLRAGKSPFITPMSMT